jgi:hypothetical protein
VAALTIPSTTVAHTRTTTDNLVDASNRKNDRKCEHIRTTIANLLTLFIGFSVGFTVGIDYVHWRQDRLPRDQSGGTEEKSR